MRSTGVVSKRFLSPAASDKKNSTLTLLGQLKSRLQNINFSIGKQTKIALDGTVRIARTVYGKDYIEVDAAPSEQLEYKVKKIIAAFPSEIGTESVGVFDRSTVRNVPAYKHAARGLFGVRDWQDGDWIITWGSNYSDRALRFEENDISGRIPLLDNKVYMGGVTIFDASQYLGTSAIILGAGLYNVPSGPTSFVPYVVVFTAPNANTTEYSIFAAPFTLTTKKIKQKYFQNLAALFEWKCTASINFGSGAVKEYLTRPRFVVSPTRDAFAFGFVSKYFTIVGEEEIEEDKVNIYRVEIQDQSFSLSESVNTSTYEHGQYVTSSHSENETESFSEYSSGISYACAGGGGYMPCSGPTYSSIESVSSSSRSLSGNYSSLEEVKDTGRFPIGFDFDLSGNLYVMNIIADSVNREELSVVYFLHSSTDTIQSYSWSCGVSSSSVHEDNDFGIPNIISQDLTMQQINWKLTITPLQGGTPKKVALHSINSTRYKIDSTIRYLAYYDIRTNSYAYLEKSFYMEEQDCPLSISLNTGWYSAKFIHVVDDAPTVIAVSDVLPEVTSPNFLVCEEPLIFQGDVDFNYGAACLTKEESTGTGNASGGTDCGCPPLYCNPAVTYTSMQSCTWSSPLVYTSENTNPFSLVEQDYLMVTPFTESYRIMDWMCMPKYVRRNDVLFSHKNECSNALVAGDAVFDMVSFKSIMSRDFVNAEFAGDTLDYDGEYFDPKILWEESQRSIVKTPSFTDVGPGIVVAKRVL